MAIRVALHHHTTYRFDHPVNVSPHVIRLRPAPHARTPIHAYSLKIDPPQHFINWMQDPFGNFQARLVFPEKIRELSIAVDLMAEMTVINPFDFFVEGYAEHYPFDYEPTLRRELAPYLEIEDNGPLLRDWL
ncbi:MAG: dehydrogenase, partial [Proteobacteria bacterium]|nr:dehydrogenase [Pseudomonadota bacterium]